MAEWRCYVGGSYNYCYYSLSFKLVIMLTYVEIIMFSKGRVSDIASSLTNQAKKTEFNSIN